MLYADAALATTLALAWWRRWGVGSTRAWRKIFGFHALLTGWITASGWPSSRSGCAPPTRPAGRRQATLSRRFRLPTSPTGSPSRLQSATRGSQYDRYGKPRPGVTALA